MTVLHRLAAILEPPTQAVLGMKASRPGGERPLHFAGIDPERAYTAAVLRKLKESQEHAEAAAPVSKKIDKADTTADPLRVRFAVTSGGESAVVEYEPHSALRTLEEIRADILALERETEGLVEEIVGRG